MLWDNEAMVKFFEAIDKQEKFILTNQTMRCLVLNQEFARNMIRLANQQEAEEQRKRDEEEANKAADEAIAGPKRAYGDDEDDDDSNDDLGKGSGNDSGNSKRVKAI